MSPFYGALPGLIIIGTVCAALLLLKVFPNAIGIRRRPNMGSIDVLAFRRFGGSAAIAAISYENTRLLVALDKGGVRVLKDIEPRTVSDGSGSDRHQRDF